MGLRERWDLEPAFAKMREQTVQALHVAAGARLVVPNRHALWALVEANGLAMIANHLAAIPHSMLLRADRVLE